MSSDIHNLQGGDYDTMPRCIIQHLTICLPDGKPGELILILPYSESTGALKVAQLITGVSYLCCEKNRFQPPLPLLQTVLSLLIHFTGEMYETN